jgi:hypothetical protein
LPLSAFDFTAMKNLEIMQAQGIAGPENAFHVRDAVTGEIFATCKGSRRVNQFETERRAKVFAAAPPMRDALEAIATQAALTARTFPNAPGRGDWLQVERIARAAILKAEGGK